MTNSIRTLTTLALTSLLVVGCAGDDDEGGGANLQGVYALDMYEVNETGCDTPGEMTALPNGLTHMLVYRQSFFGQTFHTAQSFTSEQDARDEWAEILADPDTLNLSFSELGFTFERASGNSASGSSSSAFGSGEDPCMGTYQQVSLMVTEGVLVMDFVTTDVDGVPRDSDGFCESDGVEALAAQVDCSGREVVTGTFVPAP